MCHRVQCKSCGKATWAGCGAHIEQALAGVPHDQRCTCREQSQSRNAPKQGGGFKWFGR